MEPSHEDDSHSRMAIVSGGRQCARVYCGYRPSTTSPQIYYSLDKTRPWNELATNLDPRMSDFDYDRMRSRYFYDVVAPKLSESDKFGGYHYFMQGTDRPLRWDRLPIGEPPRAVLPVR